MTLEERIEQLRKLHNPEAAGVWEIRWQGQRCGSRLGDFDDVVKFQKAWVPDIDHDFETLEFNLVHPGATEMPPRLPEPKMVRIEYEFDNGEIRQALGADAEYIHQVQSDAAFHQWNHGYRYKGPIMKIIREAYAKATHHAGGTSARTTIEAGSGTAETIRSNESRPDVE